MKRELTLRFERLYAAFNARDVDAVLAEMRADVEWPNGMEGGHVRGHDAVRGYWARQWTMIDPNVTPRAFSMTADGRIDLEVRQLVKDLTGAVIRDSIVHHVYALDDAGLIRTMEIRGGGPVPPGTDSK